MSGLRRSHNRRHFITPSRRRMQYDSGRDTESGIIMGLVLPHSVIKAVAAPCYHQASFECALVARTTFFAEIPRARFSTAQWAMAIPKATDRRSTNFVADHLQSKADAESLTSKTSTSSASEAVGLRAHSLSYFPAPHFSMGWPLHDGPKARLQSLTACTASTVSSC